MSYRPHRADSLNKTPNGRINYPDTKIARGKKHFWGQVKGAYGVDNPEWYTPVRHKRQSIQHLNYRSNNAKNEYLQPHFEREFQLDNLISIKINPSNVKIPSESVGVQVDSQLPKIQTNRRVKTQLQVSDKMTIKESAYFTIPVDETCSQRKLPAIRMSQPNIEYRGISPVLPEKMVNLRDFIRKISPSFTSSVRNPLTDAHQQFMLIAGRK